MAWRQQPLPLFGCWCFQGLEGVVVVLVGYVLSAQLVSPVPWLGDPPGFGCWGKYSLACVPLPCSLALLTGDFPGLAFPHIGMV